MKSLSQIKMDAIVASHRKKLINGAIIIQMLSMIMLVLCMYGIITDSVHYESYSVVFAIFAITGAFGMLQHSKHKRDFK